MSQAVQPMSGHFYGNRTAVEFFSPYDHPSLVFSKTKEEDNTRLYRVCYCCGSSETRIRSPDKDHKNPRPEWYLNHDNDNNVICALCYRRYILNPKWNPINRKKWNPIINRRKITFKNKQIYVGQNPRIGICSICKRSVNNGEIKYTHMHHLQYFIIFPWLGTVEVCNKCHSIIHKDIMIKNLSWYNGRPTPRDKTGRFVKKREVMMEK